MGHIALAQMGARRHYAVPRILHSASMLDRLYTDFSAASGWPRVLRIVPQALQPAALKRLLGRVPQGIPIERITSFNKFGIEFARRLSSACSETEVTTIYLWAGDRFNELVIQNGLGRARIAYGFNSACHKFFAAAKERGMGTIMEQTIAPRLVEYRLLQESYVEGPVQNTGLREEILVKFAEREKAEWALSDIIVCGSDFVRQGIAEEGGPVEKCVVVPYGVNLPHFCPSSRTNRPPGRSLQILFVGGVGRRKGVDYLLDAMRQLSRQHVHCRVVGKMDAEANFIREKAPPNVEFVGPLPRSEIAREYAKSDVFCLPSLCEGSAAVIYEALAAGLPVVTTHNAGSIVRDGIEGFIVPIRDSEAIARRFEQLAVSSELLATMSKAAQERSAFGSIEAYQPRLIEAIASLQVPDS